MKPVMTGLLPASRRGRVRTSLAVALSLLAATATAEASPRQVERALELYQAGQLTRALTAFERALASGDNVAADMPTIYRHLGELRAGAGDAAGAEEAFKKLLELDASATAGAEWSPVVLEPFERARTAVRGTSAPPPDAPPPRRDPDPVRGTVDPNARPDPTPAPVRRPTPEHGALGPLVGTTAWAAPGEPESSGILGSPWFWGGVTAFVAAAVAAAIVASSSGGDPYLAVEEGLTR